ncbi:MAG: Ig domain-containing protein [Bacteroidales bacterium]|nr:Ig domain-containing protein [Bacteroidales bacterium]
MNMSLDGTVGSTYRAFGFAVRCVREEVQSFVPVSDITLDRQEITLTVGESETLLANVAPDNASDKTVLWNSDAPAVASVDGKGKVTALKAGTATITATSQSGGKTATCTVTVVETGLSVKASFTGIDLTSGGSFTSESPYWKMTAGTKLTVAIDNMGSGTITVTGLRLICAKTGTAFDFSIDQQLLESGKQLSHTITLAETLYSPTLEYAYRYGGNAYTVSTQFTGVFDTSTTEPYPLDPFDPGFD